MTASFTISVPTAMTAMQDANRVSAGSTAPPSCDEDTDTVICGFAGDPVTAGKPWTSIPTSVMDSAVLRRIHGHGRPLLRPEAGHTGNSKDGLAPIIMDFGSIDNRAIDRAQLSTGQDRRSSGRGT